MLLKSPNCASQQTRDLGLAKLKPSSKPRKPTWSALARESCLFFTKYSVFGERTIAYGVVSLFSFRIQLVERIIRVLISRLIVQEVMPMTRRDLEEVYVTSYVSKPECSSLDVLATQANVNVVF